MNPTQYIMESCEHQFATTPKDYIGMARAYEHAIQVWQRPGSKLYLSDLHDYISRVVNKPFVYFRAGPATFANGVCTTLNGHDPIADALGRLIFNCSSAFMDMSKSIDPFYDLTDKEIVKFDNDRYALAKEFYFAFEEIHPWPDGNGRVGSILFNLLNGTISNPIHPPQKASWIQPAEDMID